MLAYLRRHHYGVIEGTANQQTVRDLSTAGIVSLPAGTHTVTFASRVVGSSTGSSSDGRVVALG